MSNHIRKYNSGVTIFEVIVAFSLMSVVIIILADVFIMHSKIFNTSSGKAEVQFQSVSMADVMGKYIRLADSVVEEYVIGGESYETSSSELVLKMPSIDASDNIIADTWDYIAFYRDETDVAKFFYEMEADPASSRVSIKKILSDYVSGLNFIYDNAIIGDIGAVSIEVFLKRTSMNLSQRSRMFTSYNLGNK